MTKLSWDVGREYETGVDRGVFFPRNGEPEPWNGLVSVEQIPEGRRSSVRYQDGVKIVNHRAEGPISARITSFFLPPSFRPRLEFDFSYRVTTATGHKIHLIYNALAVTPGRSYSQSIEPNPIDIDISTRTVAVTTPGTLSEHKPSSHLIVDTSKAYPGVVAAFEDVLYGSDTLAPRFPSTDEVFETFDLNALYKVIDNGDGTFTLEAPDEAIEWLTETLFEADWPRPPVFIDEDTYVIRSW